VVQETLAGVAAGVNAMILPITTCTICGLSALEARCKTFDATADGYGRGEAFAGNESAFPMTTSTL